MLRKKALAFALAFALVLPMAYVPTTSYAYYDVTRAELDKVAEIVDISDITDEFVNKYKNRIELYLSAPKNKEIKNIEKLESFQNLRNLRIESNNLREDVLKKLIFKLSNLSTIEISTNKFVDLGSIFNETREFEKKKKIETVIEDIHIDEIFTKDTIDNPVKLNGKPIAVDSKITVNGYEGLDVIDNGDASKIKIKNFSELVKNGPVEIELKYSKTIYRQVNTKQLKDIEFKGNIYIKLDKPGLAVNVENGKSNKIEARKGEKIELTAEKSKDGKKFDKWVSDDVEITNADSSSGASFIMPDKDVKVRATYKDYDKISSLEITSGPILMTTTTTQLQLKVTPEENDDEITWTSSRQSVATVDNRGHVTAIAKGETVITARSLSDVTTSVNLKVETEGLPDAPKEEVESQRQEESKEPDKSQEPDKAQNPDKAKEPEKAQEPDKAKEADKKSDSNDKESKNSENKNNNNSNPSTPSGGNTSSSSPSSSGGGGGGGGGGTSSKPKPVPVQEPAKIPSQVQEKAVAQEKVETSKAQEDVSKEVKVSDKMTTKEAETKVNSLKDTDKITWSKEAVVKVVQKGIMQGNKGNFMPKKSVTRAEVAQVIANIIGEKTQTKVAVSDVNNNKWYAKAVQTVLENKIFTPDAKGNFRPQSNITRAELFVAIAKFKGVKPLEQTKAKEVLAKYKDVDSVPNWALGYVSALVEKGIVKGSNNKISVNDNLTREQLATIFANIVE